jgi:hypothetical protein
MGQTFSTSGSDDHLIAYWRDAVSAANNFKGQDCENQTVGGGYSGSCGSMVGGIDDLTAEYDTTVSSKAKRDLIKKLSDGISKALKVSSPSSGASNDEMVAHMLKIVPNPRKGKSIIADKGKQAKLCQDIADVINKNYGKVIDKSLGPDGVCNQVSDIVESLSAGLNQEYVAVAASVERALSNLQDLKQMLEQSYGKLHEEASKSDDNGLKMNITGIKSVHNLLMTEVQRQLAILSNLTRTNLRDEQRELSQLLAENKDFKGLVGSIKSSMGTSEWGDKLGFWLAGVNNVAQMALRVDKALKVIGMKASDYKNASKLSDLTMKTHELMEKMPASKLSREYIDKYESAIEILKKHHGHHNEIAKQVKGAYQGGEHSLESSIGSYDGGVVSLKKKLDTQGRTRKLLVKDFKTKMSVLMDRIYQSIFKAGRRIGSGHIKLTDELYRFKTNVSDMTVLFKSGIEYALTGYYTHATATQHRDRFLGLLKSALMTLEQLKGQDESFRDVASNIEAVLKLVDFFNDKFNIHTGHTAPALSGRGESEGAGVNEYEQDDDGPAKDIKSKYEGAGEFKAIVTLRNARNTFNHFYSVAKFKTNLKVASTEMKRYDEKYSHIVGSAVANAINTNAGALEKTCNEIDSEDAKYHSGFTTLQNKTDIHTLIGYENNSTNNGFHSGEWSKETVKTLLQEEDIAKVKLYKVAQAVDVYLQKFTDAVAASPDDIQEVSKLLGSVEIMANWFNEKSGDSIASLFEVFPWTMVGLRTFMNKGLQTLTCGETTDGSPRTRIPANTHYYTHVASTHSLSAQGGGRDDNIDPAFLVDYISLQNGPVTPAIGGAAGRDSTRKRKLGLPGVPFFPISPGRAVFAKNFAKYSVDKVYVLKNLVSAFAYLGRKFGNEDLTKSSFMSPNEMYKCLSEYLYTSAFCHGWKDTHNRVYGRMAGAAHDVYPGGTNLDYGGAVNSFTGSEGMANSPSRANPYNAADVGYGASRMFTTGPYLNTMVSSGVRGGPMVAVATLGYSAFDVGTDVTINPDEMKTTGAATDILTSVCNVRKDFSFAMAGIDDRSIESGGVSMSGWENTFEKEDNIFVVIIKAMAAKVFTVTGLYNMLNFSPGLPMHSLHPARLIMGGGSKGGNDYTYDMPKIYPEAVELYARLPLLAEFYRDVFCFEEACEDDTLDYRDRRTADTSTEHLLISMVPEVGSLWSGFIQTVFKQPIGTNGKYTENALKHMIHEINSIFQAYKGKGDAVRLVISDFVAEINNRYGLMTRGEAKTYQNEEGKRNSEDFGDHDGENLEDFDVLDVDNMGTGVAPSDRYTTAIARNIDGKHDLNPKMYEALKIFRRRVDKRIADVILKIPGSGAGRGAGRQQYENTDFHEDVPEFGRLIMSTRDTLKTIEDPSDRFKHISHMMVSMDTNAQTDTEASVMFHESIVAPLAVLTSITNMLTAYQKHVREWNAPAVWKALKKGLASAGADSLGIGANIYAGAGMGGVVNNVNRVSPWLVKEGFSADDANPLVARMVRRGDQVLPAGFMGLAGNAALSVIVAPYKGVANPGVFTACTTAGPDDAPANLLLDKMSMKHVAYCIIRWEAVFKNLINAVYGLSSDLGSMCDVQFTNGRVIVNHTKLQMICLEVFSTVRSNLDKFRNVIPDTQMLLYDNLINPGSVPWVQENLVNKLFNDSDKKSGLMRAHAIVTESFALLSNKDPDGGVASAWRLDNRGVVKTSANVAKGGWCVDGVLSEMTHYNSATMTSITKSGADDDDGVGHVEMPEPFVNFASVASLKGVIIEQDIFSHLLGGPPTTSTGQRVPDPNFIARYDYYLQNSANGLTDRGFRGDGNDEGKRSVYTVGKTPTLVTNKIDNGSGLMMKFNEVMAQYISQFWDPNTLKIYSPLIETPANGPLNQEVFKAKGWPDIIASSASDSPQLIQAMTNRMVGGYLRPADDNAIAHVEKIMRLRRSRETLRGFKGYSLDLDLDITGDSGVPSFNASAIEMWSLLVKHSLGTVLQSNAIVAPGGAGEAITEALIAARGFNTAYDIALGAAAGVVGPLGGAGATLAAVAAKYNDMTTSGGGKSPYLIGPRRIPVNARAIVTHIDRIRQGIFPCNALFAAAIPIGPNGTVVLDPVHYVQFGARDADIWENSIDNILGLAYTEDTGNITQPMIEAAINASINGLAVVGGVAPTSFRVPISTGKGKIVGGGFNAGAATAVGLNVLVGAAAFTLTLNPAITSNVTVAVPAVLAVPLTYNDANTQNVILENIQLLSDLLKFGSATQAVPTVPDTNWAAAGSPVNGDYVTPADAATGLGVDVWHGQMMKHLFSLKRSLITLLNRSAPAQLPTWKQTFAESARISANRESDLFSRHEQQRVSDAVATQNIRHRIWARGEVTNPYSTISRAAGVRAEIDQLVENRTLVVRGVLDAYVNTITGYIDPQEKTAYDAATMATLALEPVHAVMVARAAAYRNAVVAVPFEIGLGLFSPDLLYRDITTAGINSRLHMLGSRSNIFQDMKSAVDVDACRTGFAAGQAAYRSNFTTTLDPNFLMYRNLNGGVAVAAGAAIPAAGAGNPITANDIDGTAAVPFTYVSRLVGAGISDIAVSGKYPSPVDIMEADQAIVGGANTDGGMRRIFGAAGGAAGVDGWNLVLAPVLLDLNDQWQRTLRGSGVAREQLPSHTLFGDGDPVNILFASLARAIRTALTEVTRNVKVNVTQSIAEVPIRMKEVMKAHLPVFNTMFNLISKRANILKGAVSLGIGVDRATIVGAIGVPGVLNVHGGTAQCDLRDQTKGKQWYTKFLDQITNACETMSSTIESVLNELNDAPLYLEVNENSITDYKNRNSKLPFMPLSSMTLALVPSFKGDPVAAPWGGANAYEKRDPNLGYPDTSTGDPLFSFIYGTRLLLQNYKVKPLIDHMPGVNEISKKYNSVSQGQRRIEEKTFGQYMGKVVDLLRYTHNTRLYSTLFGADRRLVDDSENDQLNMESHPTYQMTVPVSSVIELTTGSDKESAVSVVVSHVNSRSSSPNIGRNSSIMYNILDLNISPINVHAMRREIPLINIYNYSHTFDSFITGIVQSGYVGVDGDDQTLGEDVDVSSHDVLAGLCRNPYIRIPKVTYYGKLRKLVSGSSSIDAYGYPKFISDQLWGKALLQNTVVGGDANVILNNARRDDRVASSSHIPSATVLRYNKDGVVTHSDPPMFRGDTVYHHELGRLRFDTKFARNLFFLANVQRIMLHKINTELTSIPYPVASGPGITNRKITDYNDGETYGNLSID